MLLIPDEHLVRPLESPYFWLETRLNEIGRPRIGPSSSIQEINEALFDLMEDGRVLREDREAWDQLRHVEQRLAFDFCMYQVAVEDDQLLESALWDLDPPLELPDFLRLADGLPDFARSPVLPEAPEPAPPPYPVKIDFQSLQLGAVDIGSLFYDEETLWGDDDA